MSDTRPAGSFTAEAWRDIAGWRAAVAGMPFIRALANATLPAEAFGFYLAQDAVYLTEFARTLSIASGRAPTPRAQAFFAGSAHTALEVESALHRDWLGRHGGAGTVPASPVTAAYTDHLLATAARDGYPVLVAAVLPCYWLYAHIGEVLLAEAGDLTGHAYAQWIATYADPGFREATDVACDLADEAAERVDADTRTRMLAAFARSSMHEFLFFEQGLTRPSWPVPPAA